jgi:AcrR family transcriptional regulator
LPRRSQPVLEPRKSPVQARSAATVNAILEATIQVLLQAGKERLTTTKVARRAGVSVGTLYQYFPNKTALLRAALKQHMDEVAEAIELVCREQKGNALEQMASALMTAFLEAKMKDAKASVALYAVSSDIEGAKIAQEMATKSNQAVAAMLKTASEQLTTDPDLIASMLQGVMGGVSRRLLESADPESQFDALLRELIFLSRTYLKACSKRTSVQEANA